MIKGEATHYSDPSEALASFIDDDFSVSKTDVLPILFNSQIIPLMGKKSPRILVNIQDQTVPILLDSGAEVSVLPKTLLEQTVTHNSYTSII